MKTFFIFLTILVLFTNGSLGSQIKTWIAKADLHVDSGSLSIGTLTFTQKDLLNAPVRITGTLRNLVPNTRYHGFHVHMFALSDGEWNCANAGAHWNPYGTNHGGRIDPIDQRHVGDLGNIWADSTGSVNIGFEDSIIQLHNKSKSSILNKSIVIHADEDDLGRGKYSDSHTTGHAGARIACGNIRLVDTVSASETRILWPFDLNTNDVYNIYNGIPVNNPSYVPSPVSSTAIHLRATLQQSVIVTQSKLNFASTSFTVQCWVYPTSLSVYDNTILAQCQSSSPRNCLHLGIRNATLYMNYYGDTLKGSTTLKMNIWYHVTFAYDSASAQQTIYLNGKQDGTRRVSTTYQGTNDPLTIGTSKISRTHQTYFDGYIDQLSFVSLMKSTEDIARDATLIPSITATEILGKPNVVSDSAQSADCDDYTAVIQQQTKVIEQQIAKTHDVLQLNMDMIASLWEQQQQNRRVCQGGSQNGICNDLSSDPSWSRAFTPAFTPPDEVWCPWRGDCTQALRQPGQITIEMNQKQPLAFELHMSISDQPDNTSYTVHLLVNRTQVVMSKTVNGTTSIINTTSSDEDVLHDGESKYWLSIDYQNLFIKYGQGEVRDRCTLLRSDIPSAEKPYVRKIQYAHISFNNSREVNVLRKYERDVKLKLGRLPVVDDPALIVVSPRDFSLDDHFQNNTATQITRLHKHLENLYYDVFKWQFQDDKFPHFFEAIEHSIRNETGWCGQKLREKASRFGKPVPQATYLRITVGRNRGTSPGVPYVLEIWPPGHYSPIHDHANTYGIIRVLYGEINVKLYRTLSVKKTKPIHETIIYENQVTWLSPGLNQIHKLENKSLNKSCITIQAYEYRTDETTNYEYFNYVANDGKILGQFDPVSDMDYFEFKQLMMNEWNNRFPESK